MSGRTHALRAVGMYLRPDVVFEPLVNSWYAWAYLIAPATAAMLTSQHQIRVLESFLRQPELHRRAVNESAMRGGMVVDYQGDTAAVSELLARTRSSCGQRLEFAQAVRELNQLVLSRTEPLSLADQYARVPGILKGVVELVYDLNHRATFRFIEKLLYDTPLHDESLQSITLSADPEEKRPFALSTPRLSMEDRVSIPVAFRSPQLASLLACRRSPMSKSDEEFLLDSIDGGSSAARILPRLLTDQAPAAPTDRVPEGSQVRVRYFGHATALAQTRDTSILIDPLISYSAPKDGPAHFTLQDLPDRIDFVLLTHAHQDHVSLETLIQLRDRIGTIVVPRCATGLLQDPSLRLMLQSVGFAHVVELDELDSIPVPGGRIIGVPFLGEHADLDIRGKLAYGVELNGHTVLFLADSNALEPRLYERIGRHLGAIDALYIGMECDGAPLSWLYGPLYTRPLQRSVDQSRRLNSSNASQAMDIVRLLRPTRVFVYAMGLEPWLGHVSSIAYTPQSAPITQSDEFVAQCSRAGIPAERLFMSHELALQGSSPRS